jgi:tripartite-type tricarboxylate transporter receptor subunit TctC
MPSAPGGAADLISRLIGQVLTERFGQQIVIENHAGASSNIAIEMVVRAPPDGYMLVDLTSANAWNTALYDNLKFDIIHDITPVASIYRGIGVLVVNPSLPAKTIPEFIAYGKANPGKLHMVCSAAMFRSCSTLSSHRSSTSRPAKLAPWVSRPQHALTCFRMFRPSANSCLAM